ncbi:MAG: hypothetical protein OEY23_11505 [Acidimicrobiia bacterium]|nr:hypothetical protein [Acidimicrobiia bacterium]
MGDRAPETTGDTRDDAPLPARRLRPRGHTQWLRVLLSALGLLLVLATDLPLWKVLAAMAVAYGLLNTGFNMVGSFARPVPEPPPRGELRRVRLEYRCSLCGTEVRMTAANDDIPEAPRHCMEDMDLLPPRFE